MPWIIAARPEALHRDWHFETPRGGKEKGTTKPAELREKEGRVAFGRVPPRARESRDVPVLDPAAVIAGEWHGRVSPHRDARRATLKWGP